jgi:hypothetical protein
MSEKVTSDGWRMISKEVWQVALPPDGQLTTNQLLNRNIQISPIKEN